MRTILVAVFGAVLCFAEGSNPLLLQKPTVNKTHVVFSYAGDLWSVPRDGGDAARLTTGVGVETNPIFSPDGTQIAFQGEYDGNVDVYVMPAEGGVPKRLTYHPAADTPTGWTPDGKQILFRSNRESYSPRFARLFTIPVEGGFPTAVDLPMAEQGVFSPDGKRLAYLPIAPAFGAWKRYRGGEATAIWIATLSDAHVEKIPRQTWNDYSPMWVDKKIYFLSDQQGPFTLYNYDLGTKKVTQTIANTGLDIKSASAGPGAIVYEQFGGIYLYDLKAGKSKQVDIKVSADIPALRPSFEKVGNRITSSNLSPAGVRAVFEARGEIFTVPAEKGDVRNLTNTSGIAERNPAWSPDGKLIAYFSDESGEYQLQLRKQDGMGDVQKINLGNPPAFYYNPTWSPDNKKIAYTNSRNELWYIDLDKKSPVKIDKDTYDTPFRDINPVWSPDSKWIAYTGELKNHLRALCLYSIEEGKKHQVSDGLSDAEYANFDKNGKYLYFTASTNLGLRTAWLDMSSLDRQSERSVYAVVLNKKDPSPLAPESDDEKIAGAEKEPVVDKDKDKDKDADTKEADKKDDEKKEGDKSAAKKDAKEKEPVKVQVDLDRIDQRIIALPIPARDYVGMLAGKTGILFLSENVQDPATPAPMRGAVIYKFDLKTRKTEKFVDGVRSFDVSSNGEKILFSQGPPQSAKWTITGTAATPKPGEGALKTDGMEARVDPREEWKQMYREVWRIERDYFYDPGHHGLNLETAAKKYEPYLPSVASRADLTYLFQEMLGELSVGHLYVSGGALPDVKRTTCGLLGADYKVENGRYRFVKIYEGENWNPELKAPLTQPGVNVSVGDYLLAVNGRDVRPPSNVFSFFEETANKSVVLRVGPDPGGANSREVTVVPIANETALRNRSWMEANRRKVDQLSGGKLAYVYLPNTAEAGYTNFNRYYFAQTGKEGAVIDERFNGGGSVADYIVDYLNRPLLSYWATRNGEPFTTPQNAIFGPKAMIVNEYAGSGGDALPWMFKQREIGKLIGKRTWGGLVGIFGFPPLIDGGFVTAPNLAFWNPKTTDWEIENHGVAPDIEVDLDPAAVRAGHDPQLERAVEVVMAELKKHPLPTYKMPAYPNYHKKSEVPTTGAGGTK